MSHIYRLPVMPTAGKPVGKSHLSQRNTKNYCWHSTGSVVTL